MSAGLLQFAASLVAVSLLVAAVHLAGFSRPARLGSEAEARELAKLAPGGFVADRVALDHDGRAALLADSAGRLLLLRAHGGQFVPEPVGREAVEAEGESLLVRAGGRAIALRIGPAAADWRGIGLAV